MMDISYLYRNFSLVDWLVTPMTMTLITEKLRRIQSGQAPRYMDLFAGCGGISLGFLTAGFQPVASVEIDLHAARSHGANFGSRFVGGGHQAQIGRASCRERV